MKHLSLSETFFISQFMMHLRFLKCFRDIKVYTYIYKSIESYMVCLCLKISIFKVNYSRKRGNFLNARYFSFLTEFIQHLKTHMLETFV